MVGRDYRLIILRKFLFLNLADFSIQYHVEFLLTFSDNIAVKDEPIQEVMKPVNDQKTYAATKPAHA
jgi:hypothetical protein